MRLNPKGKAALVHIKKNCTSVRSNLRFFDVFVPNIMFCAMQSHFGMIVTRINRFFECFYIKYMFWIIRTFLRIFEKIYPPKIYGFLRLWFR